MVVGGGRVTPASSGFRERGTGKTERETKGIERERGQKRRDEDLTKFSRKFPLYSLLFLCFFSHFFSVFEVKNLPLFT